MNQSPVACSRARFQSAEKSSAPEVYSRTLGKPRAICGVRSVEPLSTTTISSTAL